MCQRTMTEASETESNEEERPIFCPYNRESLAASEARIAEEEAKKIELKKKREEGEVSAALVCYSLQSSASVSSAPGRPIRSRCLRFVLFCVGYAVSRWMEAHL